MKRFRLIVIGIVLVCCAAAVAVTSTSTSTATPVPWGPWTKTPPWVWWHVAGQEQALDVSFATQPGCQLRADVAEDEGTVQITE